MMLPLFFFILFYFFRPCCVARGILVPQPEMEPVPPAVGARSLNYWTTREVPCCLFCTRQRGSSKLSGYSGSRDGGS